MLTASNLYSVTRSRYEEAGILQSNQKPDGAVYLCGYAVELILKRHIVKKLEWIGYPDSSKEFEDLKSFKVHDLNILIKLAGLERKIQNDTAIFAKWQIVKIWNSEMRYRDIGSVSNADAQAIIYATRDIVNFILAQN